MQFIVIAPDHTDAEALDRRKTHRPAHLAAIDGLKASGNMLNAGAMISPEGTVLGSVIMCEFESRADVDKWLETEPFVKERVWNREKIDVKEFRPAPAFENKQ